MQVLKHHALYQQLILPSAQGESGIILKDYYILVTYNLLLNVVI